MAHDPAKIPALAQPGGEMSESSFPLPIIPRAVLLDS